MNSAAVKKIRDRETELEQQLAKQQQVIKTVQTTTQPSNCNEYCGEKRKGGPGGPKQKPKPELTKCKTSNKFHFGSLPV